MKNIRLRAAFALCLGRLREEFGMTQEQLAEKVGVSRITIAGWESKRTIPDIEKMERLKSIFNVDYEYLFGESEYKRLPEAQKIIDQYDETMVTIHHLPSEQQEQFLILLKKLSKIGLHEDIKINLEQPVVFNALIKIAEEYVNISDLYSKSIDNLYALVETLNKTDLKTTLLNDGQKITKFTLLDIQAHAFTIESETIKKRLAKINEETIEELQRVIHANYPMLLLDK